jgi:phenylpyruvate tautomerase PptA (4-oxalocrotonate tautomerase family)
MPIIDVEVVGNPADPKITQELADELGQAFRAKPGKVWVRVRALPAELYAENDEPGAPQPVFVTILTSHPPEGTELQRRIKYVTNAVARFTGRDPGVVHVMFDAAAKGRVAFGGVLVK